MKYIKKPIPVDAWQIDFELSWPDWVAEALLAGHVDLERILVGSEAEFDTVRIVGMKVKTLEGVMTAKEGDYLIKGPKGDFWFNKKDIFEEMYEAVEE